MSRILKLLPALFTGTVLFLASAAAFVIAEVEEIVPTGSIEADSIHTPGSYINRIVKTVPEKRIEQRTVRKG